MKRDRDDFEQGNDNTGVSTADHADDFDDDDLPVIRKASGARVRQGHECPYLDTVSRQNLDFDFEKCCSETLSRVNIYACLVCGKYFQGRGQKTPAYTHALETQHHMFMKLASKQVFCLPDNYEVVDRSLDDIRHNLDPHLTPQDVATLDTKTKWARALDGSEYMPGLIGLNNMKANDYVNAIVQVLARVTPIRDFFLGPENYSSCKSELVQRFGELMRKLWNTRNFKGQSSPHELMQAIITTSKKRFIIEKQSDTVEFCSWLLNSLHAGLTGNKPKKQSVITRCLQGELQVTTEKYTGKAVDSSSDVTESVSFLMLALDLPPMPLYKDAMERSIIPQVPIFQILKKFDGETVTEDIKLGRRRMRILRLPPYLILHMKRFAKNNFYVEKNITIVNFPLKNLLLSDVIPVPTDKDGQAVKCKYDLVANIVHMGRTREGIYKVHIHRKSEDQWYEVQDLNVVDILPQMVALSESYMQVWELKS